MLSDDTIAIGELKRLTHVFGVKTIVETGTWKGDSTFGFAELAPYVVTIEIDKNYYDKFNERALSNKYSLLNYEKVRVYIKNPFCIVSFLGNSPTIITENIRYWPEPILFFLDAHWYDYHPLKDEIKAIKLKRDSIIAIHDFQVPNHPELGFDCLPNTTIPINYDLIKEDLDYVNPNYKISYNEKAEGGMRGILYAIPPIREYDAKI